MDKLVKIERLDKQTKAVFGSTGNVVNFVNGVAEVSEADAKFFLRNPNVYVEGVAVQQQPAPVAKVQQEEPKLTLDEVLTKVEEGVAKKENTATEAKAPEVKKVKPAGKKPVKNK